MYLYFNKRGILTTKISHGDQVRQGNDLKLVFCLDTDFFDDKMPNSDSLWTMNVNIQQPGQQDYKGPFLPLSKGIEKFSKTIDSEITYDLKEENNYYMFHFLIPKQDSTSIAGEIQVFVSLHSVEKDQEGIIISENHEYEGTVSLFVERTLGYKLEQNKITQSEYEFLLKQINALQIGNQQIINMINGTDVDLDPFIKRYDTLYNFPNLGDLKTIYIANDTLDVYIWGGISQGFKNICNFEDIDKINGGNANGRENNA